MRLDYLYWEQVLHSFPAMKYADIPPCTWTLGDPLVPKSGFMP